MKVSIIIPCYNSERYLRACLTSVLAQTEEDFEVIMIDDGSSDGTLVLAREFAHADARVSVYAQRNGGVSSARNLGLRYAQGEWITFVDSDDLLTPDALQTMLLAAKDGVDMVVAAHETFDGEGHVERVVPQTAWMKLQGERKRRAVCLRLIEGDSVLNIMCNKLHRRSLIERAQLQLTTGLTMAEDALFNLEAALVVRDVAYVNRVTYRYRMHDASAVHRQEKGELDRHIPWLLAMREMLIRRGEMEAYYTAYLDSAVLRLYKDSGVLGVVRHFDTRVLPLLPESALLPKRLPFCARAARALIRKGYYPACYPLIWFFQTIGRKVSEASFALCAERKMPS